MEVRMLHVKAVEACPFAGEGMVVVLETSDTMAHLFYPPTLDEWTMPIRDHENQHGTVDREGFLNSTGDKDQLWPVNQTGFRFSIDYLVNLIRREVQRRFLYRLPVPRGLVERVLTELQATTLEAVKRDLSQLFESTVPVVPEKPKKSEQLTIDKEGQPMAKKKREKKSSHRDALYVATPKLDPEKFRGQRQKVAKALGAFSTPKSLTDIAAKVQSNGEYKVSAGGGLTDSVHFHLRELVKSNLVKETKVEKEEKKPELVSA